MDAKDLVAWALEASMYFEPRRPGLTPTELTELGAHFGVTASAIDTQLRGRTTVGGRVAPFGIDPSFFATYEGDLRNVRAFDHVVTGFKAIAEATGQRPPIVDRDALVASGAAAGIPTVDLELAIATYRAFESVPEADPTWELRRVKPGTALPSAQREGPAGRKITRRERFAELVEHVKGALARRPGNAPSAAASSPGAPTAARAPAAPAAARVAAQPMAAPPAPAVRAPLESFPDADDADGADPVTAFRRRLPSIGQPRLISWWAQLDHDLRVAEQHGAALTQCLLVATLLEIALTTACPRPRDLKPDVKGKPVRWALPEIAKAASAIGVDDRLRARIERLYKARLRVNVAKTLEGPGPITDITADDAAEAVETLRATVRIVLAFHER